MSAFPPDWIAEAVALRRDLHAHPELLFDLPRTSGLVAQRLRDWGCDTVTEGVGRSGVVATIEGGRPGPAFGLRADMDALPIHEETGQPHASRSAGRMHACGHDGHMAMLLLAARHLAATRAFSGRAVLIFQPAEENGGAGARAMLQDGLIARFGPDRIFGLHVMPGLCIAPCTHARQGQRSGVSVGSSAQRPPRLTHRPRHKAREASKFRCARESQIR